MGDYSNRYFDETMWELSCESNEIAIIPEVFVYL